MKRIFAAVLLLTLAAPVWGQDFECSTDLMAEGKLRPLAEQGDAEAQFCLAMMREHGWAHRLSETDAAKWYRRTAEQGHARAQLRLGSMYKYGSRPPKDFAEAVKWWHKAAKQGHAEAMFVLGQESAKCGMEVKPEWMCGVSHRAYPEYNGNISQNSTFARTCSGEVEPHVSQGVVLRDATAFDVHSPNRNLGSRSGAP